MVRYARPQILYEALTLLGEGTWKLLAGGTDFYPAQGNRPIRENVLDINGLAELRKIGESDSHVLIGARTTWTDIIRAPLPPAFDALKQAAREVGSVQIQNTGTIAGNLCNASPAADGVPALLILDAEVELRSVEGTRRLPVSEFVLGNRKTARRPSEMVTSIKVPKASTSGQSNFYKLGARRYLVISIAMAAARLDVDAHGTIIEAAVAVGACSAVAQRLPALERQLVGLTADADFDRRVDVGHLAELAPIDDVRGSAEYRRSAAREITVRALMAASRSSSVEQSSAARGHALLPADAETAA